MTGPRRTVRVGAELDQIIDDIGAFAEVVIGQPLWDHQLQVARSAARIRCMLTGRQAGKSRLLAVLALHQAFTVPGSHTLIISAGEKAARDLMDEVKLLSSAPIFAGCVIDDTLSQLTLQNGATIRSVPSSQKQVRGQTVDLLILDEACFIDEDIWRAARYTIVARPQSRVIMTSTPWGPKDRFFSVQYRQGLDDPSGFVESWHWPATVSPLVDRQLLDEIRKTTTDREYRAEVLAEWVDDQGAYFTTAELDAAVREFPHAVDGSEQFAVREPVEVVGGVDWGQSDANAFVASGLLPSWHPWAGDRVLWVPYVVERFGMPYTDFIEEIAGLVARSNAAGVRFSEVVPELNGVGQMPSAVLRQRVAAHGASSAWEEHRRQVQELSGRRAPAAPSTAVEGVVTTATLKQDLFGFAKVLLQQGRLVLPNHPSLLKQLRSLEFEMRESGSLAIAVPERAGHDDLAMALALSLRPWLAREHSPGRVSVGRYRTSAGRR